MKMKEFNALVNKTRLEDRGRDAARLILVKGYTATAAGHVLGVTPQTAHAAAKRVERELRTEVGCPDGWECITVCVPKGEDADTVKKIEDRALKRAGLRV